MLLSNRINFFLKAKCSNFSNNFSQRFLVPSAPRALLNCFPFWAVCPYQSWQDILHTFSQHCCQICQVGCGFEALLATRGCCLGAKPAACAASKEYGGIRELPLSKPYVFCLQHRRIRQNSCQEGGSDINIASQFLHFYRICMPRGFAALTLMRK